jgi:hypothetical protein
MRSILVCLAGIVALLVLSASQAGCARDREGVQAADNAPIGIETGQMFVTIENKSGGPLLDLTIAIQPASAPPFTSLVSRLEAGEKRDLPLSSFSSRDGTPFNLRMIRPRSVRVTATDLTQKKYEAQAPWK